MIRRYTIWFGLTGKFYEYRKEEDRVRRWDFENRRADYISRSAFAQMLREARSDKATSVVRWPT